MESAIQNASAVENPKRDVPLACMLAPGRGGDLHPTHRGDPGIVPNAELAGVDRACRGLAYAKMFNPLVGQIVMASGDHGLARRLSLLGWRSRSRRPPRDAADAKLFPAIFGKATAAGAPLAGMVIMGVVQSLMALSTISLNLNEQFPALVNPPS